MEGRVGGGGKAGNRGGRRGRHYLEGEGLPVWRRLDWVWGLGEVVGLDEGFQVTFEGQG